MVKTSNFEEKEKWVMKRIYDFYQDPCNLEKFIEVIDGTKRDKKISLRLIDWFVTNYAKKYNISYPITRPNGKIENFSPYLRYRDQLSSYPKKLFDPFCRGDIFKFVANPTTDKTDDDKFINTAICQLHFFKWAIENLLLDYIELNSEKIYKDMQINASKIKINQIKKTKQELSMSIYQKIVCNNNPVTITFK